jgi:hypothetical protein
LPEEKAPGLVAAEPYANVVVAPVTHDRKITQPRVVMESAQVTT